MSGPLNENENENEDSAEESFDASAETGDEFGEASATWGAADPDFDRMLRDRIGPVAPMPTPAYAFERVLMAGRRRRARKLWAGASAAALVVMAGTAGTTVALNAGKSGNLPTAGSNSSSSVVVAPTPTAVPFTSAAAASPSPSASPTPSASTASALPSASAATTANCLSTDLNPSSVAKAGSGTSATLVVTFTNTSGHPCITDGYPGLEFAPASGSPLQPVTESRVSPKLKRQLTVPANGTVSTLVTYQTVAAGATPGADCYTPSVYVLVIPPNQQNQLMAPITGGPITVCDQGSVSLTPLVAGSNG